MKRNFIFILFICIFLTFFSTAVFAVRPFITHLYLADPSAHEFEGRMYVYPSHDKDNGGFFDMEDYHVFSSADLINWVDHGVVLSYKDCDWVASPDPNGNSDQPYQNPRMWAPDCAYKNGTYYFYYCAHDKMQTDVYAHDAFKIGVATSKSPSGPFVPVIYDTTFNNLEYKGELPMPGTFSIDPCVFIDLDGQAYMVWGGREYGGLEDLEGPYIVKLDENMIEFNIKNETARKMIKNKDGNPLDHYFEGPWIHQRLNPADNKMYYYLSYPNDQTGNNGDGGSLIEYAMTDSIYFDANSENVKFEHVGVVIDDVSDWTNHHSFVKYNDQWYAFFQNADMGGYIGKRSICMAKLEYDGHLMNKVDQGSFQELSAYSRIKAQFCQLHGGLINSEVAGGGDIGKCLSYISDGDNIVLDNVDFGSVGANAFEAQVASNGSGGTIEVYLGEGRGRHYVATVTVNNTGDWHNWTTVSATFPYPQAGINRIELVFKGGSGYLFNLNWFKFKRETPIPEGYSVALKSLNPNCIDNYGRQGQKYLCNDSNNSNYISANRDSVGPWEKFSLLSRQGSLPYSGYIQLNSSNNGKNVSYWSDNYPLIADLNSGDYNQPDMSNSFFWEPNFDGTISLKSWLTNYSKFHCVDTDRGNYPACLYPNSREVADIWEKFYCEVQDAPIGCIVAFKSNNIVIATDDKYLCIDNNNSGDLCVNRVGVGGDWEKFEVVDANNGYIALKSLNGNQYLRFENESTPGKANGNINDSDNKTRFQWKNNGDGTVSLYNVGLGKYISADTTIGINPVKVYANQDQVLNLIGDSTRFYCQITAAQTKMHFKSSFMSMSGCLTLAQNGTVAAWQPKHYEDWNTQSWIVETVSNNTVRIKNTSNGKYLAATSTSEYADVNVQNWNENDNKQKWILEKNYKGFIRFKNAASGYYLTVYIPANWQGGDYLSIVCQSLNSLWGTQQWINE